MNPVNGIHGNKIIHEMLPTAMICQSKTPKVLMQSDMPLCLRNSAKKVGLKANEKGSSTKTLLIEIQKMFICERTHPRDSAELRFYCKVQLKYIFSYKIFCYYFND